MKSIQDYESAYQECDRNQADPERTHGTYDELLQDIMTGIEQDTYTIDEAKERIKIIRKIDALNLTFWYA